MSGDYNTVATRHFKTLDDLESLDEDCMIANPSYRSEIMTVVFKFTKKCVASVRYGFIDKKYRKKALSLVAKYSSKALRNELADYFQMEHDAGK
jgi:ribosomal protein S17E